MFVTTSANHIITVIWHVWRSSTSTREVLLHGQLSLGRGPCHPVIFHSSFFVTASSPRPLNLTRLEMFGCPKLRLTYSRPSPRVRGSGTHCSRWMSPSACVRLTPAGKSHHPISPTSDFLFFQAGVGLISIETVVTSSVRYSIVSYVERSAGSQ